MRMKKINHKIRCDMYDCYSMADFALHSKAGTSQLNVCIDCAKKLVNELKNCLKGEKDAKKD